MKRFKLLTLLLSLFVGAGAVSCADKDDPATPPLTEPVELTGSWKTLSWIEGDTPDADRVGTFWVFTDTEVTIGRAEAVAYVYDVQRASLRIGYTEFHIQQLGSGRLALDAAERTVILVRTTGTPGEPEEPEPGDLGSCTVSPVGVGAFKDAYLTLEFETAPTLGTSGEIRIFRADDDTEVDRIDMAEVAKGHERMEKNQIINTMHDVIGPKGLKRYRIVNYEPVTLDGNTVTIRPHYDVLEYGTEYYVTIDKGALTAEGFAGIAAKEWSFSTKAKPRGAVVTVGAENADFRTVQAALDYGYGLGKDAALEIRILPGQYEEQLFMRYNNNITLKGMGAGPDDVRIFYCNGDDLNGGVGGSTSVAGNDADKPKVGDAIGYAGGRGVMLVESCGNLRFENLTLENTRGAGAQAEALYNNDNSGDCGLVAVNCKFLGYQDTLNLKGYCWFYNCLVAGDVDFIWGGATVRAVRNPGDEQRRLHCQRACQPGKRLPQRIRLPGLPADQGRRSGRGFLVAGASRRGQEQRQCDVRRLQDGRPYCQGGLVQERRTEVHAVAHVGRARIEGVWHHDAQRRRLRSDVASVVCL